MVTSEIQLPKLVTEKSARTLLDKLKSALPHDGPVTLDASAVKWLSPFGTVLLADFALKRIEHKREVRMILPRHPESKLYIEDSGLLQIVKSASLQDAIREHNVELRLLKNMEAFVPEQLSNFVCNQAKDVSDDERSLLRTWITELLTNANDHAQSKNGFWICGRYNTNPNRRDIRICVADSGIGIRQSLHNSGRYPDLSDIEAVEKALEEGVTSRMGRTGGLGLKLIAAYVKSHGGSMTIISGTGHIYIARKTKKIRKALSSPYHGTIINVAFKKQTLSRSVDEPTPFQFQ